MGAFSFGGDGMAVAERTTQQITRFAVSGLGTDEDATLEETSEFVVSSVEVSGREVTVRGFQRSWGWTTFATQTGERECEEEKIVLAALPCHDLADFDWYWEIGRGGIRRATGVDAVRLAVDWRLVVDGAEIIGEE